MNRISPPIGGSHSSLFDSEPQKTQPLNEAEFGVNAPLDGTEQPPQNCIINSQQPQPRFNMQGQSYRVIVCC